MADQRDDAAAIRSWLEAEENQANRSMQTSANVSWSSNNYHGALNISSRELMLKEMHNLDSKVRFLHPYFIVTHFSVRLLNDCASSKLTRVHSFPYVFLHTFRRIYPQSLPHTVATCFEHHWFTTVYRGECARRKRQASSSPHHACEFKKS